MTGPELTKVICEYLACTGWYFVLMNSNRYTPKGSAGLTDILAFKPNVTLLVEVKGEGDRVRGKQVRFIANLMPLLGPNLRLVVAKQLEDVKESAEVF